MSGVQLVKLLNDSTISTSQNHEGTKKHKKHKHKEPNDDQPTDMRVNTTTVDGMLSEEKRKRKKKKKDKSSENNDLIIEPSQSDTVEMQSKPHKSKRKDKHPKEAEIVENHEPESAPAIGEKKKEKKKKQDTSTEKIDSVIEPSQSNSVEKKRKRHKSHIDEETQPIATEIEPKQNKDSVIEPSQSNSVEKKRKRHKSQIEEGPIATEIEPKQSKDSGIEPSQSNSVEKKRKRHKSQFEDDTQPIATEIEPGQDKDSRMEELTQESRRKRRKTNPVEEVPKEAENGPEEEEDSNSNGLENGEKTTLRRSSRRSVTENAEMSEQDQKTLLSRMLEILPKHDGFSYVTRLEELDWDSVKFNDFSVKTCQEQFQRIQHRIRKSRTLAEIIHEAQNSNVKKMPKTRVTRPMGKRTAFQLYLKKKVDTYLLKHPEKSKREDAAEKYRSKWAALSDEEKVKYVRKAEEHNTKFQEEVEEKCRNNPLYRPPKRLLTRLSREDQKILDKADGIPERPPGSGYMLFCEIMKERLKTEMPDISNNETIAEIGHRWTSLSEGKKEHYKRKTEKIKHKFLEFLEANPEIEAKVNADKRNKIIVRKTVKRIFDGEPAKPPSSGYMIFCKEILPTLKNVPSRLRMQEASNLWAAFTEKERTEYNEKTKAAMQSYLTELEAFKEKLSPEDLHAYEEIHKKNSPPSPSKAVAGKQKNLPSNAKTETVRKRKRPASKKAKSKSPIPNSKTKTNNGGAGGDNDDTDKGNVSDSTSEVF